MKKANLFIKFIIILFINNLCCDDSLVAQIEECLPKEEKLYAINFVNASLKSVAQDLGVLLNVNFLSDDVVQGGVPLPGSFTRNLEDIKINYSSAQKMNQEEVIALFSQFLNISNLSLVPVAGMKNFYRITEPLNANRQALPTFIDVDSEVLPQSGRIRYIVLLKNTSALGMKDLVDKLKSNSALVDVYKELNALIITEEAYNIISLLKIIRELDSTTTPETMSVIMLREASAQEVVALYESLKGKNDPSRRYFGMKESDSRSYFSQDVKMISEPRTNSLIILGSKESVERVENFIKEYVDTEIAFTGRRLRSVKIEFIDAAKLARTLTEITKFGKSFEIGEVGGVRAGERYFGNISFNADSSSNNLLVLANDDDYELILPVIKKLDQRQPQVALEILIVDVDYSIIKRLGTAMRNPCPGDVNFQSLSYTTTQTGAIIDQANGSLTGNLLNLASATSPGSFVLSLGRESVWALFNISEELLNSNTIAHPFLTTVNKYPAIISVAEERRVVSATVSNSFNNQQEQMTLPAKLEVRVVPQISSDGTINLDVTVIDEKFIEPNNFTNGNKISRTVKTSADVKDGQALAIGGLNQYLNDGKKSGPAPFISNIPILGNLFTARVEQNRNRNLLILIFPTILATDLESSQKINRFTNQKANHIYDLINERSSVLASSRDPIYQWFFDMKNTNTFKLQSNDLEYILEETANLEQRNNLAKNINEAETVLDWIR
jgi:type II secretory pathway component GspD/PulD (secretin)